MNLAANAHGIRKGGVVPIVTTGSLSSGLRGESCALDVWAHGSQVEDLSGSRTSSILNLRYFNRMSIGKPKKVKMSSSSATRRRSLNGSENRLRGDE